MTELRLYSNPHLLDYQHVITRAAPDQIEQYNAFASDDFDAHAIAAMLSLTEGPRWTLLAGDEPIVVAGYDMLRPGVWQDWLWSTEDAFPRYWRTISKHARRVADAMLQTSAHRLQCYSLSTRVAAHRWYRVVGMTHFVQVPKYGRNGEDALLFSRVRQ